MHHTVHPEIAGVLGARTSFDHAWFPALVLEIHVELTGWRGDDLVAVGPTFLVSERLRRGLELSGLSGAMFAPAQVTGRSPRGGRAPDLWWLQVWGTPGVHDLWLAPGLNLTLSDRAMRLVGGYRLDHAGVDVCIERALDHAA